MLKPAQERIDIEGSPFAASQPALVDGKEQQTMDNFSTSSLETEEMDDIVDDEHIIMPKKTMSIAKNLIDVTSIDSLFKKDKSKADDGGKNVDLGGQDFTSQRTLHMSKPDIMHRLPTKVLSQKRQTGAPRRSFTASANHFQSSKLLNLTAQYQEEITELKQE